MPRLRYQTKKYLYEVHSELRFDKHGVKKYKTYYGSDRPISNTEVLRRAKENIKRKFEQSNGRIIDIQVARSYH